MAGAAVLDRAVDDAAQVAAPVDPDPQIGEIRFTALSELAGGGQANLCNLRIVVYTDGPVCYSAVQRGSSGRTKRIRRVST